MNLENPFKRIFHGTMVGDSLGLPAEGISKTTLKKLRWSPWRQRFFLGRGMLSDDSEHTFMLAAALAKQPEKSQQFVRLFGKKLKWWLAGIPAGIGFGTMRAIFKLIVGFPPDKSGVFSAGNGPAMRAAILGAFFHDNETLRREFTKVSTQITHTDPKALIGTHAIVEFAARLTQSTTPPTPDELKELLTICGTDADWDQLCQQLLSALDRQDSVETFATAIGCSNGVSGYIYRTVPVAIYAVMRHFGDFSTTLTEVLNLGGDTDTVGAITGALAALATTDELPEAWLAPICEWPRSSAKYEALAEDLARIKTGQSTQNQWSFFVPGLILRNLFFTLIVLIHAFTRIIPAGFRRFILK